MSKKINLGPVTAYAIAVANGFVGSVQEWLASLKGEKGDQGPQGPEGPKGEQVQPDLTVNDPNDPRYVKGRTHWVEDEKTVTILEEQTIDCSEGTATIPVTAGFSVGDTVTVVWNGEVYECVAIEADGLPTVGNSVLVGGEDTGEPFVIGSYSGSNSSLIVMDAALIVIDAAKGTPTVSVSAKVNTVHPIDPKYLPFVVFYASETGGIACNYDYEMTKKLIYNCSPIYAMAGAINTLDARPDARPYTFMREMAITVTVTEGNDVEIPFITIAFPTAGTLHYYSTGVIG